jgi:hypothetical protein
MTVNLHEKFKCLALQIPKFFMKLLTQQVSKAPSIMTLSHAFRKGLDAPHSPQNGFGKRMKAP